MLHPAEQPNHISQGQTPFTNTHDRLADPIAINYLHELSKCPRVNITETLTVLRLPLAKIAHYFRAGSSKTP